MLPLCLQKGGRSGTLQQALACLGHFFSLLTPCAGAGAPERYSCCDTSTNHFCFLQGKRGWAVNISLKPCTALDWIASWLRWQGGLEAETLCVLAVSPVNTYFDLCTLPLFITLTKTLRAGVGLKALVTTGSRLGSRRGFSVESMWFCNHLSDL